MLLLKNLSARQDTNKPQFENFTSIVNLYHRLTRLSYWRDTVTAAGRLAVELFIGNNKDLYHRIAAHKEEIESQTGLTFDWQELPNRKVSRIITGINVDFDNTNSWPAQFDWAADTILKMKTAFTPYL